MGLHGLIAWLEHKPEVNEIEDIGGFTITVPPGRSLVIQFEKYQRRIEIDYPHDGSPSGKVRASNGCTWDLRQLFKG
jgi:hypothetical protein